MGKYSLMGIMLGFMEAFIIGCMGAHHAPSTPPGKIKTIRGTITAINISASIIRVGYGSDELIVNVGDIYHRTVFATAQMNDGPDCLYTGDLVEVMYAEVEDRYRLAFTTYPKIIARNVLKSLVGTAGFEPATT